jgi:hypothetical protein
MRHVIGVLMGAALVAGCGAAAGGPGFESPEAGAKAMAEAFSNKDEKFPEKSVPSEEQLKAHFDCPEDQLVKGRKERIDGWPKELARIPASGIKMEVAGFEDDKASSETLAKDAEYRGCKVKEPVTLKKIKAKLKITVEGKTEEENEGFTFVEFGDKDRWFYFKL